MSFKRVGTKIFVNEKLISFFILKIDNKSTQIDHNGTQKIANVN